jgi:peptidoglycan/LPS O-acetylase OafA/YrhL
MAATLAYRLVTGTHPARALHDLALFDISGQFYFIWLLLVFGLLLTQAHRLSARAMWILVSASFVTNLIMVGFYEWHGGITGLYATLAYRNPLVWVFFPALGFALGRAGIPRLPGRIVAAAAVGMALIAAVYVFRGVRLDSYPVSYFGVTVFLFSTLGMAVYPFAATWLLRLPGVARPLLGLSRYSFPIYLVHVPFAMGFGTKELLGDGADWSNYWLLLHANAAVGLFGSLAFVRETEKLSPWLGRTLLGVRRSAGEHRPGARRPLTPGGRPGSA